MKVTGKLSPRHFVSAAFFSSARASEINRECCGGIRRWINCGFKLCVFWTRGGTGELNGVKSAIEESRFQAVNFGVCIFRRRQRLPQWNTNCCTYFEGGSPLLHSWIWALHSAATSNDGASSATPPIPFSLKVSQLFHLNTVLQPHSLAELINSWGFASFKHQNSYR